MAHSALAALFTLDAEVAHSGGTPVRGRAAIHSFLSSFEGYEVLEYSMVPANTRVQHDCATQSGTYRQRVRTPQGQVLDISGQFEAHWLREASGTWLISHMLTRSTP